MYCIERFCLRVSGYCLLLGLAFLPATAAIGQPPQSAHLEVHRLQLLTAKAAEAYREGRLGQALALAQTVARQAKLQLGEDDLRYAQALNNLALFQDLAGSLTQAERNYRRAIRIVEALEDGHAGQLAELKNNLAAVVLQQCHIEEARSLYVEGLQFAVAAYGVYHRETAMVSANIDKLDRYMAGQRESQWASQGASQWASQWAGPLAAAGTKNGDIANMLKFCIG